MKLNRAYPCAAVTLKAERSILSGHPWVYDTEISKIESSYQNGDIIDVLNQNGKYLGTGFINDHSKIRIRLLSRNANDTFDAAFFERRIKYAWQYRKTVMRDDIEGCRIVFGEADGLPGLTVDRFGDFLVAQTLSLGIEKRKELLFPYLIRLLNEDGINIRGIYERNDVAIRELEGLQQGKGFYPLDDLQPDTPTLTTFSENGIVYSVDFENGQKTGFFLDQKYNRQAVARICRGRQVLDCFTHTGSFALNAAAGGASSVHAVDISSDALETALDNARRNHFDGTIKFTATNVFDYLTQLSKDAKSEYDVIILDPPAFTKSRKTIKSALRGYKEINLKAMKILPRGGYLATCSCSHFITDDLFSRMLCEAAQDANVSLRQIEFRQQAPDHPILWNVPETNYLKFYIFQVV